MRKRLAAIARSTTFIDSARRKALLADLEAQQQAITGPIARADPALAVELLAAGRAEQALAVLDGAAKACERLEALDRREEAQQHRWRVFSATLSIPLLRDYLKRLDDFADVEAAESAFALVEAHQRPLAALQCLVFWPALPRAARYVIAHRQAWDGEAYGLYEPAAERLTGGHPLAATVLLRAMVLFALAMGRSKRYRYAAEHLRQREQREARIDHWQGLDSHTCFVGTLREVYARSWGFWQLLEP